jgi:ribosomal protein S25
VGTHNNLCRSVARRLVKDLTKTGQVKLLEAHSRQVLAVSTAPPKKAEEATAKTGDAKDVKKAPKKAGKQPADKEK